jgi:hypothetical protein
MSDEMAKKKAEEISAAGDPLEASKRAKRCAGKVEENLREDNCFIDATIHLSQTRGISVTYAILPRMNVQIPGMPGGMPNDGSGKPN